MSREVYDSTKRSKIDSSNVQDTTKIIKDWGMPCCIQLEYSVLFEACNYFLIFKKIYIVINILYIMRVNGKQYYNLVVCNIISLNLC